MYKFILLLLFAICTSCQMDADKTKENSSENDLPEITTDNNITKDQPSPINLKDTKWKLIGLFDAEAETIVLEFEPKDCPECYTLLFDTDFTATSRSINDSQQIDLLNLDPFPLWESRMYYEVYIKDGKHYEVGSYLIYLSMTASYFASNDELKLFNTCVSREDCSKTRYYLLFKRIVS